MKTVFLSASAVEKVYSHPSLTDPSRLWYVVISIILAFFFLTGFHSAASDDSRSSKAAQYSSL
jgi:hypothetical protein